MNLYYDLTKAILKSPSIRAPEWTHEDLTLNGWAQAVIFRWTLAPSGVLPVQRHWLKTTEG